MDTDQLAQLNSFESSFIKPQKHATKLQPPVNHTDYQKLQQELEQTKNRLKQLSNEKLVDDLTCELELLKLENTKLQSKVNELLSTNMDMGMKVSQLESDKETKNKTPYEILGISPDSKPDTIKQVHKGLSKIYHPDKVATDKANHVLFTEKFKAITNAYNAITRSV
jgi:DnaJ-domain-containing protein 1